jgi:hypothetical protein
VNLLLHGIRNKICKFDSRIIIMYSWEENDDVIVMGRSISRVLFINEVIFLLAFLIFFRTVGDSNFN